MGYSLVNILGGLLIVTSTMVVVSKTIPSAIKWYAIQSVVLVGVLLTLGLTTGATELLMWAASAFVTKVILVPFILNRAYKKMGSPADSTLTSSIKPAWTIILTGLGGGRLLRGGHAPEPAHRRGGHSGPRHQLRALLRRPHVHHLPAQHPQADLRVLPYGER